MIPLTSHDVNADASGITRSKDYVASPFDHLDLTNRMVLFMTLLALCDADTSIMVLHDQKVIVHIVSVILTWWIQWYYWWWHWLHIMLIPVTTVSNDWKCHVATDFNHLELTKQQCSLCYFKWHVMPTLASHDKRVMFHLVSIILTQQTKCCYWQCYPCHMLLAPVLMASHEQKHYVTLCFNFAYLVNKMMPLMMQLASHGSNAGTNGITWLKMSGFISFWSLQPNTNKYNGTIDNTIGLINIYLGYCLDMSSHS